MMVEVSIRRALKAAFFTLVAFLVLVALPHASWASEAAQGSAGGLKDWLAGFNLGSGALIITPAIMVIQWINFVVILVVLNKIIYKPLWRVIDERKGQVDGDLAASERDRSETQGYITQYEDSLAEIQRENTEAMIALQQQLAESGRKLIDEVREKTSKEMEEARASISTQAVAASDELKGNAEEFSGQIANRLAGRQIA